MNTRRHGRQELFIANEGVFTEAGPRAATPTELTRRFLFGRVGPRGKRHDVALLEKLAAAMLADPAAPAASPPAPIPAGYTYVGQFADHDMTLDKTAAQFGANVTVEELQQGRSPTLDLDTVYGLGPLKDAAFYEPDGRRLRVGSTEPDGIVHHALQGHDLPRSGVGPHLGAMRKAAIPDLRNDENLAIAQLHVAFIRFHNAVVDDLERSGTTGDLFARARADVVKHYQWMLRSDFLPRICDPAVVEEVFTRGRRVIDVAAHDDNMAMPIEFTVGAFRIGHSLIRSTYAWNRHFERATLAQLFNFGGTLGTLSPDADLRQPDSTGSFKRLPSSWIADWRRMFDLATDLAEPSLAVSASSFNVTERLDTAITSPLAELPPALVAIFGGVPNLPLRNLIRARMVELASGQQMAALFDVPPLSASQILEGCSGASLAGLASHEREALVADTPLWFYVLREAETLAGGSHLGPLGSRIVVETFHRAMEASQHSIVRDPSWRPTRGHAGSFGMAHLLVRAAGSPAQLDPLG